MLYQLFKFIQCYFLKSNSDKVFLFWNMKLKHLYYFPMFQNLIDVLVFLFLKGVKKKLQQLSQTKYGTSLKPWIASIVNHLYWCVTSSVGNPDLIEDKWKSVLDHVQNKHSGFGGSFPECQHAPLVGREKRKPWLKPCECCKLVDSNSMNYYSMYICDWSVEVDHLLSDNHLYAYHEATLLIQHLWQAKWVTNNILSLLKIWWNSWMVT